MTNTLLHRRSYRSARLFFMAMLPMIAQAAPIQAMTVRQAEITCPIDGKIFKSLVVASYSQFGVRLDQKPVGALAAPLPLPICPDNGFVMFKANFSDAEIALLKPIVLSRDYSRARKQNTSYYMVAYLRERMGADDLELANLYLKASWQAESSKSPLIKQYRSLALKRFDAFLKNDNSRSPQWWASAITAAELERLLGHFDAAETRLSRLPVAELDNKSTMHKAIEQIRNHAKSHSAAPERLRTK